MLENEIQTLIIEELRNKGCIVIRHNPISPLVNGGFKKMNVLDRGVPDLIVLGNNQVVLVEVKTTKGSQSIYQKAFEKKCIKNKIKYIVCRDLETALKECEVCYDL